MKTELLAKLESAISKFVDDTSDDDGWTGYEYDDLIQDMARAASLVFDGCMKGQAYAAKEES